MDHSCVQSHAWNAEEKVKNSNVILKKVKSCSRFYND